VRNSIALSLGYLLGNEGAAATLYHLNLSPDEDLKSIHEKLLAIFRAGTPVLERAIVKEACSEAGLRFQEKDSFDFVGEMKQVRRNLPEELLSRAK
jgi:hypothetical protein